MHSYVCGAQMMASLVKSDVCLHVLTNATHQIPPKKNQNEHEPNLQQV